MKKFTVDIEWTMTKTIEVEAKDEKEAYMKAMSYNTNNGYYVEDSYEAWIREE